MNINRHIPNIITCTNLLCGCLAIIAIFKGNLSSASYLIFAAVLLDFLDGMAARLLKVHSELGKQLDSLADMVTFGVVPGFIMYHLIKEGELASDFSGNGMLHYLALLIPVFSALRLAKFNIDPRQSDTFIGLPTPANTLLISSFPLILEQDVFGWKEYLLNPYLQALMSIVLSCLLVAEIPLFSLKFKHFGWQGNGIRYTLLTLSAILLVLLFYTAIPIIIFLYITLSIANNFVKK